MKNPRLRFLALTLLGAALTFTTSTALFAKDKPEDERKKIRATRDEILKKLIEEKPEAKEQLDRAAGYATFTSVNINVILVAAGGGEGVLVEKAGGKETFMEMGSVGVGLGAGAKNFRVVFIFFDAKHMEKFRDSGWEFGGSADATAKANDGGAEASGAGSVNVGMTIYQFTETGIALQATVAGTKYWKDKKLNEG